VLTDHSWEKMWHEHLHWKRCVLATCDLCLCVMGGCVTLARVSEPCYHAPVQVDSGAHGALLQSCLDPTSGLNDHDHIMDAAHPSNRSFLLSLTVLCLLPCQLFPATDVTLMHLQFHSIAPWVSLWCAMAVGRGGGQLGALQGVSECYRFGN
jgi:hypothetical protein